MPLQTATNPDTGETMVLVGSSWQKVDQTASKNGEKAYLVSGKWLTNDAPKPSLPQAALRTAAMTPVVAADTGAALGSGMIAAPAGGFANIAGSIIPGPEGQGQDWQAKVQNALTYQPRTEGGQAAVNVVSAPFEALAHVGDMAGGKVTDTLARVLPAGKAAEAGMITNVGIQAIPMALGKVLPKVGAAIKPEVNPALQTAKEAGIKVTPEEAGAGPVSKTLASVSGEPRLARKISTANEPVVNEKIAGDFGLPKDAELSHEVLEDIRQKQGEAYNTLRKSGTVLVDQEFLNDLKDSVKERQQASKDFPRGKDPALEMYQRLTRNKDGSVKRSFDADSAVSEIKNLREDAQEAFADRKFSLGNANLDAAKALEDILDRHLSKQSVKLEGGIPTAVEGDTVAVDAFRKARQIIAKTYDAEKALGPQGTINPQAYAKMLDKGKPLSGGALEVAKLAKDFPRSLQKPSMQATGPTFADAAAGLLTVAKAPVKAAVMMARPAVRSIIASDPYQAMMKNPGSLSEFLQQSGEVLPMSNYVGVSNEKK